MTLVSIVVLIGYIALNIFVVIQSDRCLMANTREGGFFQRTRLLWIILYFLLAFLPVLGTIWPVSQMKYNVMMIGNVILGFDIYYGGFLLIFTFIQGIITSRKKKKFNIAPPKEKWTMIVAAILTIAFCAYGLVHAQRPVVTFWNADVTEGGETHGQYRVVLLGDFHLSVNSNPKLIQKAVDLANAQNADAVLLAGDYFTSNYDGLKNPEQYIEILSQLTAREGVYGVYGNHDVNEELFCGFAIAPVSMAFRPPEMEQFVKACGFTMLEDDITYLADGKIVLVGRKDADKAGDGTSNRKSVQDLLAGVSPDETVFVLEHEPLDYVDLDKKEADAVFSGHTHRGQIWPCNIFINLMTKNAYGYKDINGMATFVTSGVGFFGPPMRSGTDSEVMVIDITY